MLVPKEIVQQMGFYNDPGTGRLSAVRLDFNENLRGASPKVMETLRLASREACGCYPEYEQLTQGIACHLGVEEACILPTNGSDEAIKAVFDVYVDKGDEVILLSPSYAYEHFAQLAGAAITWIAYREDFSFPLEEILKVIQPTTRLIVIANPNNPTGTLIPRRDLVKIVEANPAMAVLVDEAYYHYARLTNIDLTKKYGNILVSQTFSKAYGLAGLRIGYLVSAPNNIQAIAKVLSPTYSVNCMAAMAALAAMEDKDYMEAYVDEIIAVREMFVEEIAALGFQVIPSRANFVLVHFGIQAGDIKAALKQQGILVRERRDLKGYLRISIGPREIMGQVINVVCNFCAKTALIFDMDGVLVDESCSYRICIARTVEQLSSQLVSQVVVEMWKRSGGFNNDYDCVEAILKDMGVKVSREAIMAAFDTLYQEVKFQERWLVDKELLNKLKGKYRLGIFTGRPKRDAEDALKRFGMESVFDAVITDDDVKIGKPDPEGLLLAMQQLQVQKAIYFGDTLDDRKAAHQAAVDFIEVEPPGKGVVEVLKRML